MRFRKDFKVLMPIGVVVGLALVELVVVNRPAAHEPVVSSKTTLSITTSQLIQKLESAVAAHPASIDPYLRLGQAYNQAARETADTAYYDKIDQLLSQANKLDPKNPDLAALQAIVAYGRHHFREGLIVAQQAVQDNPNSAAAVGLVADAQIELGQYDQAAANIQTMVDRKPDYAAYVRVAYIRELYGDIPGAIDALNTAISASSNFPENIAWAYNELGKLHLQSNLSQADQDFQSALHVVPNYPPALDGLGRLAFFRGDSSQAEKYIKQAFDQLPIAQYAIDLGDLNSLAHHQDQANVYYTLAATAYAKSASGGIDVDQEIALFEANTNRNLDDALSRAQAAVRDRPSIFSSDALAWVQYRRGNFTAAQAAINEALRLGEHDATVLFHAGLIAAANHDRVKAQHDLQTALKLNPHFSILFSQQARDTLQQL